MRLRVLIVPSLVILAVVGLVTAAARSPLDRPARATPQNVGIDVADTVGAVDRHFEDSWRAADLKSVGPADDLLVLRRLSLALHGTVPSLQEIREFEADDAPDRLGRWTERMLADSRFADYFAERLARSFVGTEQGPFLVFRRDRFTRWLSEQLRRNRPYDEVVRRMLADEGLWTGRPAVNFITAAVVEKQIDAEMLAGRAARAFLGQRIDCAQCHDHPFAEWKQADFQGLAASFGQVRLTAAGVEDRTTRNGRPLEYEVEDLPGEEKQIVAPAVPFGSDWLSDAGSRRHRLAGWITHPENRWFERAVANRVWGLMFGRAYHSPVDDLPNPDEAGRPDLLDMLGADFREHGYDLRRLIRVITAARPYRLASLHPTEDEDELDRLIDAWAVFPLTRLRPEQVIGSMLQATSIRTIDRNSHLLVRLVRLLREQGFIDEYGDLGENELDERTGTIPQALLRMNSRLSRETMEANPFTASGRIALTAGSDERCLETCFLVCLARRPAPEERAALLPTLAGTRGNQRLRAIEDLYWPLFNSQEFSWNH